MTPALSNDLFIPDFEQPSMCVLPSSHTSNPLSVLPFIACLTSIENLIPYATSSFSLLHLLVKVFRYIAYDSHQTSHSLDLELGHEAGFLPPIKNHRAAFFLTVLIREQLENTASIAVVFSRVAAVVDCITVVTSEPIGIVNDLRAGAVVGGPDGNFEGLDCGGGDEEKERFEKTHFCEGFVDEWVGDCERELACMLVEMRLSKGDFIRTCD